MSWTLQTSAPFPARSLRTERDPPSPSLGPKSSLPSSAPGDQITIQLIGVTVASFEQLTDAGACDSLVHIFVGLEDPRDFLQDYLRALEAV